MDSLAKKIIDLDSLAKKIIDSLAEDHPFVKACKENDVETVITFLPKLNELMEIYDQEHKFEGTEDGPGYSFGCVIESGVCACVIQKSHDVLELLLDHAQKYINVPMLLDWLCQYKDVEFAAYVVRKENIDFQKIMPEAGMYPYIFFHRACAAGNLDMVKLFVNHNFNLNYQAESCYLEKILGRDEEKDSMGWEEYELTGFTWAILANQKHIVEFLIENGQNIYEKIDLDQTCLFFASFLKCPEIAQLLINLGVNPNDYSAYDSFTCLDAACCVGNTETLKILVHGGADIHHRDENQRSAFCLLWSFHEPPLYESIILYLENNFDPYYSTKNDFYENADLDAKMWALFIAYGFEKYRPSYPQKLQNGVQNVDVLIEVTDHLSSFLNFQDTMRDFFDTNVSHDILEFVSKKFSQKILQNLQRNSDLILQARTHLSHFSTLHKMMFEFFDVDATNLILEFVSQSLCQKNIQNLEHFLAQF